MNKTQLDELISKRMGWFSPDGTDWYPERTEKVKALIREVVGEITPERRESSGYITPFEDDFFNIAVDQMEAKAKELLGE